MNKRNLFIISFGAISLSTLLIDKIFMPRILPNKRIKFSYDDLNPIFAKKIKTLIHNMNELGLDAYPFEGKRSLERAKYLKLKGSGKVNSVHRLGLAVDIISKSKSWGASKEFWDTLGQLAKNLDLTWGGDWIKKDKPHVQLLPTKHDDELFVMNEKQKNELINKYFEIENEIIV